MYEKLHDYNIFTRFKVDTHTHALLRSVCAFRDTEAARHRPLLAAPAPTARLTTQMAEGDLDVDSLISRLLEGEFHILVFTLNCLPEKMYTWMRGCEGTDRGYRRLAVLGGC